MKTLRIKFSGGDMRRVLVNGKNVTLNGTQASVQLAAGPHVIQWFIRGVPFSKFTFEVLAPPEVTFKREDQIDADRKDAGNAFIRILP